MTDMSKIIELFGDKPTGSIRLLFGSVLSANGSELVVSVGQGGTVYASSYVYCDVGDTVACLTDGSTVIAFAAKDAARLENEMQQAGISYKAGDGITIDGNMISADVTDSDIEAVRADTIPLSFIETL